MTSTMLEPESPSLCTRPSLVAGLQAGDEDRWQEFFRLYGPVIRGFALKAGLTETEADEVVQETCIGVARNVGEYRYDPAKCRFKTWLLNLASWRVKNQYTKRHRWDDRRQRTPEDEDRKLSSVLDTDFLRLAGPDALSALWEAEWREKLLAAALEKVRGDVSTTQFQIFDLNVLKDWPAGDVAKSLGVSLASVYLAKHRVAKAVKQEVARLERQAESQATP